MTKWIPRTLTKYIQLQQSKFPVLAVTGPRQSGKTTLLKHLFPEYQYISLENPDNRSFATDDPGGFLATYPEKVILDEVQQAPALFSYLQTHVDTRGQMGAFVLSGSQNFHLLKSITQTLAGRAALFRLLPFDTEELNRENLLPGSFAGACIKGFYPAIYDREIDPPVFYANYIQTYIERDVAQLINVDSMNSFRTFLGLCAGRAGQLLNLNALANECGISQPTAKSWLSILQSSYLVFLLHPYHENFGKRLIKSPKLYFYDTGLLCYLLQLYTPEELLLNRLKGNIFENMVVGNIQKLNEHHYRHKSYYFWQDSKGMEVDLLQKTADGFNTYEIKATQTLTSELFKGLQRFEALAQPGKVISHLIYGGEKSLQRSGATVMGWNDTSIFS
ncbi:MAG: ATP-binding protein [Chitinophagaceae bacterium]|nr:ATP-binding protein [Chitinophagaceae bacterium]MCW5925683.1 ATP-binding protein [Chitinophagaceae bacterium]